MDLKRIELRNELVPKVSPGDFQKFTRYTLTIVVAMNWRLCRHTLFEKISFPEFAEDPLMQKKVVLDPKWNGTILQVKYRDAYKEIHIRGYGKDTKQAKKCFPNSTSVIMYHGKIVSIKIPSSGQIQIAGCLSEEHTLSVIRALWRNCKDLPGVVELPLQQAPRFIIISSMSNISIDIGFSINKERLHRFLYMNTDFIVIMNNTVYAGLNCKIQTKGMKEQKLFRNRLLPTPDGKNAWYQSQASWYEYISYLKAEDRVKISKKIKYHTILIFPTGKIILTSPQYNEMERIFSMFISILNENRHEFEELPQERKAIK